MNLRAVIACVLLWPMGALMAASQGTEVTVQSQTRQFQVRGPAGSSTPLFSPMRSQTRDRIRLDPALTAVSAERVKQALLLELGVRDRFEAHRVPRTLEPGRVSIRLSARHREPVRVVRTPVAGGWTYRLDLPLEMAAADLTAVLVQVLLVDLANAGSAEPVDLPAWLSAGLVAHLRETATSPLSLDGHFESNRLRQGVDPTTRLREVFRSRLALTFEQLSWPELVGAEDAGLFNPSAHLFVHQLLRLDDGRESLRTFLTGLARYHNWQFAFHDAFSRHFKEPKDVEKWWAVQVSAFTGRDPRQTWPARASMTRLDEVLRIPVRMRAAPDQLPEASVVPLRDAVGSWDFAQEQIVLRRVAGDLLSLRPRVAPELVALSERYRLAIERYLEARNPAQQRVQPKNATPTSALYEQRVLRQRLGELDEEREQLRQKLTMDLALEEAERRVAISNALERAQAPAPAARR